ncbi:MAG TPA: hypothetical protein VNM92_01960 [Thermoanaerobaculia bacterium]|nr:hypothetical protein [Thermoanaerobaculia bacterium]
MTSPSELLLESAQRGGIHHAVILYGRSPEELRAFAVTVALTVNCLNHTMGDDCVSCDKTRRDIHPDVHYLEIAGDRKLIAIDQVRSAIAEATLRPYEGRTKVFIVQPAESLSVGGANSLLKTLEEPSRDTLFLLLTRSPDLLLQTIRSRSQSVHLESSVVAVSDRTGSPHGYSELRLDQKEIENLSALLMGLLHSYAVDRDVSALLTMAAVISSAEPVKEAMALYAMLLRDLCALEQPRDGGAGERIVVRDAIGRSALLSAATDALTAIDRLAVNADARMMIEQSVAKLHRSQVASSA